MSHRCAQLEMFSSWHKSKFLKALFQIILPSGKDNLANDILNKFRIGWGFVIILCYFLKKKCCFLFVLFLQGLACKFILGLVCACVCMFTGFLFIIIIYI